MPPVSQKTVHKNKVAKKVLKKKIRKKYIYNSVSSAAAMIRL